MANMHSLDPTSSRPATSHHGATFPPPGGKKWQLIIPLFGMNSFALNKSLILITIKRWFEKL